MIDVSCASLLSLQAEISFFDLVIMKNFFRFYAFDSDERFNFRITTKFLNNQTEQFFAEFI